MYKVSVIFRKLKTDAEHILHFNFQHVLLLKIIEMQIIHLIFV